MAAFFDVLRWVLHWVSSSPTVIVPPTPPITDMDLDFIHTREIDMDLDHTRDMDLDF